MWIKLFYLIRENVELGLGIISQSNSHSWDHVANSFDIEQKMQLNERWKVKQNALILWCWIKISEKSPSELNSSGELFIIRHHWIPKSRTWLRFLLTKAWWPWKLLLDRLHQDTQHHLLHFTVAATEAWSVDPIPVPPVPSLVSMGSQTHTNYSFPLAL